MKILQLNTVDIIGGAAKAAYRTQTGLVESGLDSRMMVQFKFSDDRTILGRDSNASMAVGVIRKYLDRSMLDLFSDNDKDAQFHLQFLPDFKTSEIKALHPDIIHLHWICAGFLRIETIGKLPGPVVWTMHDMWPFTGGCHYAGSCTRYVESCGECPALGGKKEKDLSRWVWNRKKESWDGMQAHFVSPSRALARQARDSSLLQDKPVHVIPNGLDLTTYKPFSKAAAREILGLSPHKKYILFSAMTGTDDERKGFSLLQEALLKLKARADHPDVELLIAGGSEPEDPPQFGFPTHYLGRLYDDISLVLYYNAADVFAAPSRQDNLPNTVMESTACGTPCTAFNIGGMPDMIEHKQTGYLAEPFDTDAFLDGLAYTMQDEVNRSMRQEAAKKAKREFDITLQASRLHSLYEDILRESSENTEQPFLEAAAE